MRSNGLLKWLVLPVALLVLFFGIRLFSGGGDQPRPMADADPQLTAEEMQALGIEGDTPRDTVATLVAQVRQLRTELQTATADNRTQREENQRLRQREALLHAAGHLARVQMHRLAKPDLVEERCSPVAELTAFLSPSRPVEPAECRGGLVEFQAKRDVVQRG